MAQGEARRISLRPGEARQAADCLEEGDYGFTLLEYGEPGWSGWKTKQGKYPNRKLKFAALETTNPVTGEEQQLTIWLSLSPGGIEYGVCPLYQASGCPVELDFAAPKNERDVAALREAASCIDEMLKWITDNNVIVRGKVKNEEYQGRMTAKLAYWHPPADTSDGQPVETAKVEEAEPVEVAADADEGEELPATKKLRANGANGQVAALAAAGAAAQRKAARATK